MITARTPVRRPVGAWLALCAVYAAWLGLMWLLIAKIGLNGWLAMLGGLLMLFVWAPGYVFWNWDDLWVRNRNTTIAFAITVLLAGAMLVGYAKHDTCRQRLREEEAMAARQKGDFEAALSNYRNRTAADATTSMVLVWCGIPFLGWFFHRVRHGLDRMSARTEIGGTPPVSR